MSTTTANQETSGGRGLPLAGDNKLMQALLIAAIAASGLSMIFSIGTAYVSASQSTGTSVVSADHISD